MKNKEKYTCIRDSQLKTVQQQTGKTDTGSIINQSIYYHLKCMYTAYICMPCILTFIIIMYKCANTASVMVYWFGDGLLSFIRKGERERESQNFISCSITINNSAVTVIIGRVRVRACVCVCARKHCILIMKFYFYSTDKIPE